MAARVINIDIDMLKYDAYMICSEYIKRGVVFITDLKKITEDNVEMWKRQHNPETFIIVDKDTHRPLINVIWGLRHHETVLFNFYGNKVWALGRDGLDYYKHGGVSSNNWRPMLRYFFKTIGSDHPLNGENLHIIYCR